MRYSRIGIFTLFALIFVFVTQQIFAQECTASIAQSFQDLAEVCTDLAGESACAGSNSVESDAADFATSGDIVALSDMTRIAATSTDAEAYGLVMLNVHGNVPRVLSDTGVHYMLLGDAAIENQTDVAEAYVPQDAIKVTAIVSANIRATPTTDGRVIAGATPGTELDAYGISFDQQWLIVLFNGESAWISRQVITVAGEGNLNDLPVITGSERSLMQAFSLTTSGAIPDCIGTPPSLLLLQGPDGFGSLIEVNGVTIRFSSTIALRIDEENRLQLIVLEGGANSNNLAVPAGFTMFATLDADGLVNNGWTGLRPITGTERVLLSPLEALPQDAWYTAIEIPTEEEVSLTLASLNTASVGQTIAGPAAGNVTCNTLRPTSPLQSMGNRPDQPFFWDGASGATDYRVNIYNENGNSVGSASISSNTSTVIMNTTIGGIGAGNNFSWEVQALVNGQLACTTGRITIPRNAVAENVGNNSGGGGGSRPTATPCPWSSC